MSENPARSEIDPKTGGGWGAPLRADLRPAEMRRQGLPFNGLLGRGSALSTPVAAEGASSTAPAGLNGRPRWESGPVTRSALAPVARLRPRPAPSPRSLSPLRVAPPQVRTVTHLDLRSVAKVSALFYAFVLVVMVIASIMLWFVADAMGAVHSIDHSVQSLFGVKSYSLHPGTIALYSCAAGSVVAVTGTLVNLLAATMYNLIAEIVGGIRIKVSDT